MSRQTKTAQRKIRKYIKEGLSEDLAVLLSTAKKLNKNDLKRLGNIIHDDGKF